MFVAPRQSCSDHGFYSALLRLLLLPQAQICPAFPAAIPPTVVVHAAALAIICFPTVSLPTAAFSAAAVVPASFPAAKPPTTAVPAAALAIIRFPAVSLLTAAFSAATLAIICFPAVSPPTVAPASF